MTFREEPIPSGTDVVFYTSWEHYYLQPRIERRKYPCVALMTHLDRSAFRLLYMSFASSCRIACMSKRWLRVLRRYRISESKLALAPFGIDLEHYRSTNGIGQAGRIRVGVVGRLYPGGRKGEDMLVKLAGVLDPAGYSFLFIGERWDDIVDGLRKRGFEVDYRERADAAEMPMAYGSMDALLICSRREGGPLPALEALACGVPIISTPVGYVPDLIEALPFAGGIFRDIGEAASMLQSAKSLREQTTLRSVEVRKELVEYAWPAFSRRIASLIDAVAEQES